jgi:hypothetical protein
MTISRRWWEPKPQDHQHDSDERARHSYDLGNLLSFTMSGGEFIHFAELLCCAACDRQPKGQPFPPRDAAAPSQEILG